MDAGSIIALIAVAITFLGGGIGAYISLNSRVGRIETILEVIGIDALKTLHSDDDHLGLDEYVDRITANYYEHHYDLTDAEWQDFQNKLREVETNPRATKLELAQARMILRLCEHKLMRPLTPRKTATT